MYNRQLSGSIKHLTLGSALLKGNPLGDPHTRTFPVYLPPGYADSDQCYPVIYALAGFTGTGLNMAGFSVWEENLPEQVDDLIVNSGCPPVIVVMPDCFTSLGGSQYVNSTATGPYEDYLTGEVITFVDGELRTLADREHRGIIGKSSGGYGVLTLAMKHPGLFAAAACHSGDLYFEYTYLREFPKAVDALNQYGGVESFLKEFAGATKKGSLIPALNIIAMAAAYSPDGNQPLLPFTVPDGELITEVWKRWLAHDPVRMVEQKPFAEALRSLNLLYLDVGDRDEFALHLGARIFIERLKALDIPYHYEEFSDGHFGINYRYKVSLEMAAKALG
ncbi:MAG: prolyl oligopeptidase family serine peptidase [Fidelibacterota bacterium]|nr:MAG: prolyl oligopeptidase family serine peptidase [Candidatus Neomarinimicrobiota bacterium]